MEQVQPDTLAKQEEAQRQKDNAIRQLKDCGFAPVGSIVDLDEVSVSNNGKLCLGMECLDRALWELEPTLPAITKLGIHSVRLQTGWARTEQKKGVYDFSEMDREVELLLHEGIQPWLSLSYGNPIYYPGDPAELRAGGIGHVPIDTEEEKKAWQNYVAAVVTRYKGRVKRYEIWNEPDVKVFMPPRYGNWMDRYMDLVRLTAPVIREKDPTAVIVGGTGNYLGFKPLLERGLAEWIDQYTFHNYSSFPESQTPAVRTALCTVRDRMAPGLKIIRGEAGCPSYNAPTSFGALHDMVTSETIQAKWAGRHLIMDLADPMITETSYFHTYEFLHFSRMHHYYYGILRRDCTRKPVYGVLQLLARLFDAETHEAPEYAFLLTGEQAVTTRSCSFERKGMHLFAYWRCETIKDESPVEKFSPNFLPKMTWEHPVLVDTLTQKVYRPEINESGSPILPLTGYAMILTEADALSGLIPEELLASLKSGTAQSEDEVKQYTEG